jgi:hypothetical protein
MKIKDITLDQTNPIVIAVEPLKSDAVDRAEKEARKLVEKIKKDLADNNNDLEIVAPYPKTVGPGALWGEAFHIALAKRKLYGSLVSHRKGSRSFHEPDYVDIHGPYVDKFIENAKEDAAFQYKQFIHKLIKKVGEVKTASLSGNHVWGYSILSVTLSDGSEQKWKTQQIVNVSKLGKLFNQWPTRKMK